MSDRPVRPYNLVMGRSSDAKHRLLEATLELIWVHSYGAVTVDGICDKARVRKGSFYHFFRSKTELVAAALDSYWTKVRPELERIFDATVNPIDRLKAFFDWIYDRQKEMQDQFGRVPGCPLCSVGSETSNCEQLICDKAQELIDNYTRLIFTTLSDLKRDGLIVAPDVAAQADALFAHIHGVLGHARITNDAEIIRGLEMSVFKMIGLQPIVVAEDDGSD